MDGSNGLRSREAGDFEKVYLYIWYHIIRYMLYCICAFFKCILEVHGVVHDILPYLFRMHDKNQPKVNIPSPTVLARHIPLPFCTLLGSLTQREDHLSTWLWDFRESAGF